MGEAEPSSNSNDISVYSPIKDKFKHLADLRLEIERGLINLDLAREANRNSLIEMCKLFYSDSFSLFNHDEQESLNNILRTLQDKNKTMISYESKASIDYQIMLVMQKILPVNYESFKETINKFLNQMTDCLHKHNADGFATRRMDDAINRLYYSAGIKPMFLNKYGIPISPEMEVFCRMLYCNAIQGKDNLLAIKGRRGKGKTRFGIGMNTTLCGMFGIDWNWKRHLVINEDLPFVETLLSSFNKYEVLQLDEAGNQINRKLWYQIDHIGFANFVTRIRVQGYTLSFIWPETKALDPVLAKDYALFEISINVTGTAIVKCFNKNPYASKDYVPLAAKTKVAISGEEADEIINQYELLKMIEIPFFDVPEKFMEPYEIRKKESLKISSIKKIKQEKNIANEYYMKFLLELPSDKPVITAKDAQSFSASEGYKISVWRLGQILGNYTGQSPLKLIFFPDDDKVFDPEKTGYIKIDSLIRERIERLRSQFNGAKSGGADEI